MRLGTEYVCFAPDHILMEWKSNVISKRHLFASCKYMWNMYLLEHCLISFHDCTLIRQFKYLKCNSYKNTFLFTNLYKSPLSYQHVIKPACFLTNPGCHYAGTQDSSLAYYILKNCRFHSVQCHMLPHHEVCIVLIIS